MNARNLNDRSVRAVLPVSRGSENLENAVPCTVPESCILSPRCSTEPSVAMDSQGHVDAPKTDHLEGTTSQVRGSADIEPRYLAAVGRSRPSALGDAAFPPLPGSSKSCAQYRPMLATLIHRIGSMGSARAGIRVLNAADARSSPGPSRDFQTAEANNGFRPTTGNDSIGQAHSKVAVSTTQPSPVARVKGQLTVREV